MNHTSITSCVHIYMRMVLKSFKCYSLILLSVEVQNNVFSDGLKFTLTFQQMQAYGTNDKCIVCDEPKVNNSPTDNIQQSVIKSRMHSMKVKII